MRLQKIGLSFRHYGDADFLTKAIFIISCMTGNIYFPDPIPILTDLGTAVGKYSDDLNAATGLGKINVSAKNKSRAAVESILSQLGMFIMFVANGDQAILTSTGYTLTKAPEPGYIDNPGNVTLTNGITSGELISQVKTVKNAILYFHEITDTPPTDDTVWGKNQSSKSRLVFTNLTPGKQYWVRIAAAGRGEQIAYSTIASQFVQ